MYIICILNRNCRQIDLPYPLFSVEFCRGESDAAELDDEDLREESPDPDCVVNPVTEESLEHIPLAMNLPGVDLVEEGHHDERVEHHRKVDCGGSAEFCNDS